MDNQPTTIRKSPEEDMPVIKCLPRDDFLGGMMFWCPFCKKWHRHGRGNGHRLTHCGSNETPFKKHGYEMKMMTIAELKRAREAIDEYLRRRHEI